MEHIMKKLFISILLLPLIFVVSQETQKIIYLQSGDRVTGEVIKGDPETGDTKGETDFGIIEIKGTDILKEVVTVFLKKGDKISGSLIYEDSEILNVQTIFGIIKIDKEKVKKIDYGLKKDEESIKEMQNKFIIGDERQIDVFYDPTGYCLEMGTLYFSGLSWGFGITDKFQITSRWSEYFIGNFNIRPKFQIFKSGDLDNEQALAIGFHFHNRALPNKYQWLEKTYMAEVGHYTDYYGTWQKTGTQPVYYGAYERIGSKIISNNNDIRIRDDGNYIENDWIEIEDPERNNYVEFFTAYTISKARQKTGGRIYHTFGAYLSKFASYDKLLYKIYYAGAVDLSKKLIFNYEIFYDPFYVEWWNRDDFGFDYDDGSLQTERPEKPYYNKVHFDVGFIYAHNDWLRFGIHFQPYVFGIYMKF